MAGYFDLRMPIVPIRRSRRLDPEIVLQSRHIAPGELRGVHTVTYRSGKRGKLAVETCAGYLCREQRHEWSSYSASRHDESQVAYLFTAEAIGWGSRQYVGACAFGWDRERSGWMLEWVWLHPYARRRGVFGRCWPYFRKRFGGFGVVCPLSPEMTQFLAKRNESHVLCPSPGTANPTTLSE